MRITWAMVVYLIWFAVMGASLIVAGVLTVRKAFKGFLWGLAGIFGGLLTWAFVSAVIGLYEMPPYYRQPGFYFSLVIGAIGVALFGLACAQLRRHKGPGQIES